VATAARTPSDTLELLSVLLLFLPGILSPFRGGQVALSHATVLSLTAPPFSNEPVRLVSDGTMRPRLCGTRQPGFSFPPGVEEASHRSESSQPLQLEFSVRRHASNNTPRQFHAPPLAATLSLPQLQSG